MNNIFLYNSEKRTANIVQKRPFVKRFWRLFLISNKFRRGTAEKNVFLQNKTKIVMRHLSALLSLLVLLSACNSKGSKGNLNITMSHSANEKELVFDTMTYSNEFGNQFTVTEIQYFISNIELCDSKGSWTPFNSEKHIFYIDTDIEESQTLKSSELKTGQYTKIRFTFGMNESDNVTGHFTDAPEANMFWPEPLGGGYHYMKLNGRWIDDNGQLSPMNVHLGIGQNSSLTEFYHNHFQVELPVNVNIVEDGEAKIQLNMVIDNWFRTPNIIDLAEYGSGIMQSQEAQALYKANGNDVFKILP